MRSFSTKHFEFVDFIELTPEQSEQVLQCRNLPEIRVCMVNTGIIDRHIHQEFVRNLRNNSKALYYSIYFNNNFVGAIYLQIEHLTTAERGIYLHPSFWGRGLSKKITTEFYKYISENFGIETIKTKVKKNNKSSNALENSLGALKEYEDDKYIYYSLDLTETNL